MDNQNAIATVFYDGVEKYLKFFLESIEKQTYKDFKLIIFNNGLNNAIHFLENTQLDYKVIDISEKPILARVKLIAYLKDNNFEKVIFSDADDMLYEDRCEQSFLKLNDTDIVVNDFDIIDEEGNILINNYLSRRLKDRLDVTENCIKNFNFMGLTNTAAKISIFKKNYIPLNLSLKAYDWYLWKKLLIENNKAIFFSSIKTFYRLHESNISSLTSKVQEKEVINGIKEKLTHYSEFIESNREYKIIRDKLIIMERKSNKNNWVEDFQKKIENRKILFPLWWEKIIVE